MYRLRRVVFAGGQGPGARDFVLDDRSKLRSCAPAISYRFALRRGNGSLRATSSISLERRRSSRSRKPS